jgi:hypothetical protein
LKEAQILKRDKRLERVYLIGKGALGAIAFTELLLKVEAEKRIDGVTFPSTVLRRSLSFSGM